MSLLCLESYGAYVETAWMEKLNNYAMDSHLNGNSRRSFCDACGTGREDLGE